jgi:hypothetical protein
MRSSDCVLRRSEDDRAGVLEAGVIRMLKNLARRDFGYARAAAGFSSVRNAAPGQRAAELSN